MKTCRDSNLRTNRGAAFAALTAVASILIVGALGLFAVEVVRTNLARQELTAVVNAAALAGAVAMASTDSVEYGVDGKKWTTEEKYTAKAHRNAELAILNSVKQNSLVGVSLASTRDADVKFSVAEQPVGLTALTLKPNELHVFYQFLDPTKEPPQPVDYTNSAGTTVRVWAVFGLMPMTGTFLPIGQSNVIAVSDATLPKLDVVMGFDFSGSMDDETDVTYLRRSWDPNTVSKVDNKTQGAVTYTISTRNSGGQAKGIMYSIYGQPYGRYYQNAAWNQHLHNTDSGMTFKDTLRASGNTDQGAKPGNYPNGTLPDGSSPASKDFSDLIVNINDENTDGRFSEAESQGYKFPNMDTMVEAFRGNLENTTVFLGSGADTALTGIVTPLAGYQDKYRELANLAARPLGLAKQSALNFFKIFNTNCDAHFGFVAFSTDVGSNADSKNKANYAIADNYTKTAMFSANLPQVILVNSKSKTDNNYYAIKEKLLSTDTAALEGTNIGESIHQAYNQLNNGRVGAKRAIVLFTDGLPNEPGDSEESGKEYAVDKAGEAGKAGIPIYSVGLLEGGQVGTAEWQQQEDVLKAITDAAKNGSEYYHITDVNDLDKIFENIARQLVTVTR